jgi:hypothetical protein
MAGGTSLPYGNVKNMFILSCTPAGTNVGATSIIVAGTGGAVLTFTVPGLLPGDCVLDINRPSNTINGNITPAFPFVDIGNAWVSSANTITAILSNTSVATNVTIPIEAYIVCVGRPDTTNPPTTTPTGVYS